MTAFRDQMERHQLAWKARNLPPDLDHGLWNGRPYAHILPTHAGELALWRGLRGSGMHPLAPYLRRHRIQPHKGRHNLLSSWTLCANLYFPFRDSEGSRDVLASFLGGILDVDVLSVDAVELEFALPPPLDPRTLLGERAGKRGANQTSPDVAFEITLAGGGRGLVLTEVKWTEHNFYACSGHRDLSKADRVARCGAIDTLPEEHRTQCAHAVGHGRRYWEQLAEPLRGASKTGRLTRCPAATSGYQLFRQQALAEALAATGEFDIVASTVACDARNTGLLRSLRSTGVQDLRTGWGPLFDGRAHFALFSHQQWVEHVRRWGSTGSTPTWSAEWASWVTDRYGFAET